MSCESSVPSCNLSSTCKGDMTAAQDLSLIDSIGSLTSHEPITTKTDIDSSFLKQTIAEVLHV